MTNLVTREVFDDLFDFRHDFDQMFRRVLSGSRTPSRSERGMLVQVPPIEAWVDKEGKRYHLKIALPGVDAKDVKVELQGRNLTVRGEHQFSEEKKEAEYLHQEFSYGRFKRSIVLPEGTDTAKLTAEFNNGVLEVAAPLSEAALPKQIEVKSATKAKGAGA